MNYKTNQSVIHSRKAHGQRHCSLSHFSLLLALLTAHCSLLIVNCDLFTGPKVDVFQQISDEVDYAAAPWVPLQIEAGNMGTASPMGIQDKIVKKGYSFKLSFQPLPQYPFRGWRAWVDGEGLKASWRNDDKDNPFGAEQIRFESLNSDGTEVTIFVYYMPPEGKRLIIGPWGADAGELSIAPTSGNLGSIFPAVLSGIKQGFPFTVSFQPSAAYPFRGWQASVNNTAFSTWKLEDGEITVEGSGLDWSPLNVSGLEMSITINELPEGMSATDTIVIAPIGWDSGNANARIAVPEGWGTATPPAGQLSGIRQTFPFDVEFVPSAIWAFEGWRAYSESEYNKAIAGNSAQQLSDSIAAVTLGTNGKAKITVNNADEVVLVPWCNERPKVTMSNPPLTPTGVPYSRGQQIKIWFNTDLDYSNDSTVPFGDGYIQIMGQNTATGELYDDPLTPENENGNLIGCFLAPFYDTSIRCITIAPDSANFPPGDHLITVTVGTQVLAHNKNGMISPVSFSYSTNTLTVKKVYNAIDVWAIHNPLDAPSAEKFFYRGGPRERDSRIRKTDGQYKVTLYFSVSPSIPAEMNPLPDALKIAEIDHANLAGGENDSLIREATLPLTTMENTAGSAGAIYRSLHSNETVFYKAEYVWTVDPTNPGIIRLAVIPYRTGSDPVTPDIWQNASAEGRFVAVVYDNQPPSGNANITLSGQASISNNVYNYNSTNNTLSITGDFSGVADNGNFGIRQMAASMDKPWTMEEQSTLQWRFRIVEGTSQVLAPSSWYALDSTTRTQSLTSMSNPTSTNVRNIQVQYKDSLGNESGWSGSLGSLTYNTSTVTAVSSWSAEYRDGTNATTANRNTVYVSWTNPANIQSVEIAVDGVVKQNSATNNYTISSVPAINDSGVRSGQAVSNVTGYTITLTAVYSYGRATTVTFKIWNIPDPTTTSKGMTVNNSNQAVELTSANFSTTLAADGRTYVLTQNVDLGTWTPPGTFTGKFYGNGHTVTISGIGGTAADRGLFGIANNAVIRDLTVIYNNPPAITGAASTTSIGGIAGQATGNTAIINCIARGADAVSTLTVTAAAETRLGGIAGYIGGTNCTTNIQNCRMELNVSLNATVGYSLYVGGVVGFGQSNGTYRVRLTDIVSAGTVKMNKTNSASGSNYCGGIGGSIYNTNLTNCKFIGKIDIPNTFNCFISSGFTYIGGLIGMYSNSGATGNCEASSCEASGDIVVQATQINPVYIGGVIGSADNISVSNSRYLYGTVSIKTGTAISISTGGFIGGSSIVNYENCQSSALIVKTCVTGTASNDIITGGFVGNIDAGTIGNCSSSSNISVPAENTADAALFAGGFCGKMNTSVRLEKCFATGSVNTFSGSTTTGLNKGVRIGGFVGLTTSISNAGTVSLTQCYATGDVTAVHSGSTADFDFSVGGLIGHGVHAKINECYATGNVKASKGSGGTTPVAAGGLVGLMGRNETSGNNQAQRASITDCYALGNVTADNPNADSAGVYAGGLVGYVQIFVPASSDPNDPNCGKISRSFAGGSVTTKNASNGAGAWAGGVVGYKVSGVLNNTAHIGRNRSGGMVSITAQGGNARNIGRVYGDSAGIAPADNYANANIYTGTDASYYTYSLPLTIVSGSPTAASADGANATNAQLSGSSFWTTNPSPGPGMGFTSTYWNFAPVSQGCPVLLNVGGQ
ncbi:hypothetical protein R84B8_03020 [Treponema sp. R8-4-B8]